MLPTGPRQSWAQQMRRGDASRAEMEMAAEQSAAIFLSSLVATGCPALLARRSRGERQAHDAHALVLSGSAFPSGDALARCGTPGDGGGHRTQKPG
jgi:hypothetical protein